MERRSRSQMQFCSGSILFWWPISNGHFSAKGRTFSYGNLHIKTLPFFFMVVEMFHIQLFLVLRQMVRFALTPSNVSGSSNHETGIEGSTTYCSLAPEIGAEHHVTQTSGSNCSHSWVPPIRLPKPSKCAFSGQRYARVKAEASGLVVVTAVGPTSACDRCLRQMALETDAISQSWAPFGSNHWCSVRACVCVWERFFLCWS